MFTAEKRGKTGNRKGAGVYGMTPMLNLVRILTVAAIFIFLVAPAGAAEKGLPPIGKISTGDRWYLILLNDEATGFLHTNTIETVDGYRITAESSVKITVLGFTRESSAKEAYEVNKDLTLRTLHVEQIIDKSPMTIDGSAVGSDSWKIISIDATGRKEKTLKAKGAVFPPAAVNLYPLLKGFVTGKKYGVQILDPEEAKLKKVEVRAVAVEREGNKDVLHLANDMYPFVSNDVWVDREGTTLRESVRDGLVVTKLENAEVVQAFISDAAVSRRDLILDFSMIRPTPPLNKPGEKKRLVVEFSGYPQEAPLPSGPGELAVRSGDKVTVTVERKTGQASATPMDATENLAASSRIPSDHPDIVALSRKIIGEETNPRRKAELLTAWVSKNIAGCVTDSQSPLETLKTGKGNCQAHSRLFASLSRAAGIPTRFVSGLVYAEGQGFLYHSWNESIINDEWVSLDATFGQLPSDATHIRIATGDSPADMAPLAALIGKLKAKIISFSP